MLKHPNQKKSPSMLKGVGPEGDLIDRLLCFANLEPIARTGDVESTFEGHPFVIPELWNKIPNQADVSGFINLQRDLRAWLQVLRRGSRGKKIAVRDDLAKRFQEKAVETALILKRNLEGEPYQVRFNAWGIPRLDFEDNGQVKFSVRPFLSGVESAVYYGVVLLFHRGLLDNVERCAYRPKGGPMCARFFVRTKQLVAYCSTEHQRAARLQKMRRYVAKSQSKKRRPHIEPRRQPEPIDPNFVRFMNLASKPALKSGEIASIEEHVRKLGGWDRISSVEKEWRSGKRWDVWERLRSSWQRAT